MLKLFCLKINFYLYKLLFSWRKLINIKSLKCFAARKLKLVVVTYPRVLGIDRSSCEVWERLSASECRCVSMVRGQRVAQLQLLNVQTFGQVYHFGKVANFTRHCQLAHSSQGM